MARTWADAKRDHVYAKPYESPRPRIYRRPGPVVVGFDAGRCVDCQTDTMHSTATVGYLCLACRAKRDLPIKIKGLKRSLTVRAMCRHQPPCLTGEDCMRRSVAYAMGWRPKP